MKFFICGVLFFQTGIVLAQVSDLTAFVQENIVETCDGINKKQTCAPSQALPLPQPKKKSAASTKRCNINGGQDKASPPTTQVSDSQGKVISVSELSEQELNELSNYVTGKAKRFGLTDSMWVRKATCALRSHLTAYDFQDVCQVKSAKIFATGISGNFPLKDGSVYHWDKFHVANVVYVRKNGQLEPYVIDKLMSDDPMPLADWKAKVNPGGQAAFRLTDPTVRTASDSPSNRALGKADDAWATGLIQSKINESSVMNRK